jgi:hypothetical protein
MLARYDRRMGSYSVADAPEEMSWRTKRLLSERA